MLFLRGEDTWLWSETPYIAAVFMAQIFKMAVKVWLFLYVWQTISNYNLEQSLPRGI